MSATALPWLYWHSEDDLIKLLYVFLIMLVSMIIIFTQYVNQCIVIRRIWVGWYTGGRSVKLRTPHLAGQALVLFLLSPSTLLLWLYWLCRVWCYWYDTASPLMHMFICFRTTTCTHTVRRLLKFLFCDGIHSKII